MLQLALDNAVQHLSVCVIAALLVLVHQHARLFKGLLNSVMLASPPIQEARIQVVRELCRELAHEKYHELQSVQER